MFQFYSEKGKRGTREIVGVKYGPKNVKGKNFFFCKQIKINNLITIYRIIGLHESLCVSASVFRFKSRTCTWIA